MVHAAFAILDCLLCLALCSHEESLETFPAIINPWPKAGPFPIVHGNLGSFNGEEDDLLGQIAERSHGHGSPFIAFLPTSLSEQSQGIVHGDRTGAPNPLSQGVWESSPTIHP